MFFLFQVVAAQKAAPAANLASQKAPPAQAAVDKQAENARNRQAQKGCGHDPNGGICEACQKKAEFMERMKREKAGESKQSSPEEYAEAKKESANKPEQAQTGCGHDPNGGICEACQKKAEFMERMKQEKMKSVEVLAEQALPARETAPAPETAADFRQAEKTVFSESAPQLRQADLQSATQVSQAVALNTAFELTRAEEEARKRGKNRESRQPENAAEQNRAEAGAREENAAPVRETTGSGGGKAEAGGKERWQKAESGCEKAAAGGENAYKQRAAVAEEKGIGTLQQRGQGETGGSQKGANGAKKQYVIGEYTYEDILATAWLRKMYGHLIGLAESEETSAGETVREAGGKSARKEKPQSREVLGKKDEQRGKETEKPSGKKTGAEAQEKEKPKAAAKETRDAKANAHLKESANEKARRKGEIEKAKTGAKLEGKEKAGIKEQEGAKRSPAEKTVTEKSSGKEAAENRKKELAEAKEKPKAAAKETGDAKAAGKGKAEAKVKEGAKVGEKENANASGKENAKVAGKGKAKADAQGKETADAKAAGREKTRAEAKENNVVKAGAKETFHLKTGIARADAALEGLGSELARLGKEKNARRSRRARQRLLAIKKRLAARLAMLAVPSKTGRNRKEIRKLLRLIAAIDALLEGYSGN